MDDLIREMIAPRRTGPDRPRRARLGVTVLTVALAAAGVTSLTTSALFTDTESVTGTEFTTGTVQIAPTRSTTVTFDAGNMAPGDTVYGAVVVDNSGSLQHRYAISTVAANGGTADLAGLLELSVHAAPPGGADVEAACDAAGLGGLTQVAAVQGLPTATARLVGDPQTGPDAGDRTLAALTGETLCFVVHLPAATSDAYQGASATLDLVFDAEQTVNNS